MFPFAQELLKKAFWPCIPVWKAYIKVLNERQPSFHERYPGDLNPWDFGSKCLDRGGTAEGPSSAPLTPSRFLSNLSLGRPNARIER